jgi:16S rRNA (cytidine1402-2'-O)-methyltransferase
MATLYIVATPIGNLEDITLRALRVLAAVDLIACEDTRVSARLLRKYGIATRTVSYHARSGPGREARILATLAAGKSVALISDSGTPAISDPGSRLAALARERFGESVRIEPIPGPNAAVAALSAAGVPASEFLFLGFLPHKKGREALFDEIAAAERTVVFYESPHRIARALESLAARLPERRITLARELTKLHEEFLSGTPRELASRLAEHPDSARGEFVVVVPAR